MLTPEPQLKNIMTDGYLVIRQFLSSDELREYSNMFTVINSQRDVEIDFKINNPDDLMALPYFSIRDKLDSLVESINYHTGLDLNYRRPDAAFFDTSITALVWHQDDVVHHECGKRYKSLNFWMPIIKPESTKSGLCIIPPMMLKQKDQSIYDRVVGRGDIGYIVEDNKTSIINRFTLDTIGTLDFDINDIAVTPIISSGDLLLFRGDVPHRTQDYDTYRVAMGVRYASIKQ